MMLSKTRGVRAWNLPEMRISCAVLSSMHSALGSWSSSFSPTKMAGILIPFDLSRLLALQLFTRAADHVLCSRDNKLYEDRICVDD